MIERYRTASGEYDISKERFEALEQMQRATMNILEDFDNERRKYLDIQKATMNLLEDFDEERRKFQMIQKATMNLLEDMYEERKRTDEVKTALMNILEDIESERTKAEQISSQLEYVNRELEAFSYSVSHDLRAPLRALSGFAEAVMSDYAPKIDEKGNRYLRFIRENAHIMGQLIDDLLAFSRTARQPISVVRIDMAALGHEVFREITISMADRTIDFGLQAMPLAFGDRALIKQVLTNLLSNAVKFTRPRKTASIELGYSAEADKRAYYVKDNGVGFDMKYAEHLFGVFQRLHSTAEFEGTGVGLALVNRIITRHGGRIWAEAHVDQGATFYFTLPEGEQDDGG